MRKLPIIAMAVSGAVCAIAADTTVSVSHGFPDQSAYAIASGTSSVKLNAFHSFVSMNAASEGHINNFNSSDPCGFHILFR